MKVRARINNYRSSASKARLIAPVIKGLNAVEAQVQLEHLRKGCADDVKKLIGSAIANAENNHGLSKENLFVAEYIVEEGKTMKRWMPRAHGSAAQILKRTCNIIVGLEEKDQTDEKSKKESDDKKQAGKVSDKKLRKEQKVDVEKKEAGGADASNKKQKTNKEAEK
jgi:large subunit ribosomal protein L22